MSLTPGTHLGVYEITAQIGEGGMGQVYRARDTKLDRDVAIKILPEAFADDADRLARFQREAKTLASLNHPNIAAIYGLEESGGMTALVMELVEGDDLSQRIARGAIPVDEALPIARQIAEALEAAHEQGIIHRDLKPANVKVRPDGTVKVLDFGLAKALAPDTASPTADDIANSPTLTAHATQMGVILGTAAYMAPEQARGKPVDKRADIWAFGAVLYEMLTGAKPFPGDDVSQTLAKVIEREPDMAALPPSTPSPLHRLLSRCLEKNPKRRLRDIGDALIDLDEVSRPYVMGPNAAHEASAAVWRRALPLALGASVVVGLVAGLAVWRLTPPRAAPVARVPVEVALPVGAAAASHMVAVSPDGRAVVYRTSEGLRLRSLDRLETVLISGTEGCGEPFFSPDGRWIGCFVLGFARGSQLLRAALNGAAPVVLAEFSERVDWGASWGDDDLILFGRGSEGIWQVPSSGGTPEQLIAVEDGEVAWGPQQLPGDGRVLFTLRPTEATTWDEAQIVVESPERGERLVVIEGGTDARYVETGHLLYVVGNTLFAVPFDPATAEVSGAPVPVVDEIMRSPEMFGRGGTGSAHYSVSAGGTLVYVSGSANWTGARQLVWVDRLGREEFVPAEPAPYFGPRIAPDGRRVALEVRDEDPDIWVWDFARQTPTRLTLEVGTDAYAVWTPDGRSLVYTAERDNQTYVRAADGTGSIRLLIRPEQQGRPQSISPDGEWLVLRENHPPNGTDLSLVSMEGGDVSTPLIQGPFNQENADLSPDGRWIVYQSDESGEDQVYVRPFPDVDGARWQISPDGGGRPVWARTGAEIFYVAGDRLMVVRVSASGGTFDHEPAELLLEGPYFAGFGGYRGRVFDVSPDAQRVLVMKPVSGSDDDRQMVVVLNWLDELRRLVPTP